MRNALPAASATPVVSTVGNTPVSVPGAIGLAGAETSADSAFARVINGPESMKAAAPATVPARDTNFASNGTGVFDGFGPLHNPNSDNEAADPVDVITGYYSQDHVDLRVNGPLPIEIRRTYFSANKAMNDIGYGWLSSYPSYLIPANDRSTIEGAKGDGSVILFHRQGTSNIWALGLSSNTTAPNGSGGSTDPPNDGIVWDGGNGYQWHLSDGSIRYFSVRTFTYGPLPYLSKIVDSRGNYLAFAYGSNPKAGSYGRIIYIRSSNGGLVGLTYSPLGLVLRADASDGRTVRYAYTYVGDLKTVQMPDGQIYSYAYGTLSTGLVSNHLIRQITFPDNRILQCTYDSNERVIAQTATVGAGSALAPFVTLDYSEPGQTTVMDALNRPTVYQYSGGSMTRITDPMGRSVSKTWYPSSSDVATGAYPNALESITDKRGLVTKFKYNSQGNVIQTEIVGDLEGDGRSESAISTAAYNDRNRPLETTDASGITTRYSYSGDYPYLPTQITTSKGETTLRVDQISYTTQRDSTDQSTLFGAGLIAQKVFASGSPSQSTTQYSYNSAGFLTQKTDLTGTTDPDVVTTYDYNSRGEWISATDGDGRSTTYAYDGLSRPSSKIVRDETGKAIASWTTTYDGGGNVTQIVGPRTAPANSERRTYDGWGRLMQDVVSQTQADTKGVGIDVDRSNFAETDYVVDASGDVVSSTDPLGNVTTFDRNLDGEIVNKVTDGRRTESFQYDSGGNVVSYTNPLGGVTFKSYTSTGKLCRQQNPDGSVLQWFYYVDGRLRKEVLRNGSYWITTYDDLTRTVTRTLSRSDGVSLATETDVHDPRGNLISHTNGDGDVTTTTYDGLNRVKTLTGPDTVAGSARRTIINTYGRSAKTLTVKNGLGETTTTTYDALGRPVRSQVKDGSGNSIRVTVRSYSDDNNATTVTRGSGPTAISSTTYTDASGRVLMTRYGDGTFAYSTYDPDGNLLSSTDALNQTTRYAYNALNQRISETLPDGSVNNFTYDLAGNLLTRASMPGGLNLEQTFDPAGRKRTEILAGRNGSRRNFAFAYYPSDSPWAGLLETTETPRSTITVTYDDFLRSHVITTAGSLPETNSTTRFSYDNRGHFTSISQSSANDSAGPATKIDRTYDGYGSVLSEVVSLGGQVVSNVFQAWDAAGRRASLNDANSSIRAPLFSYRYQADGLLAQVIANNQNYSFGYADNGLLNSRTSPFRSLSIDTRDVVGRILKESTAVAGMPIMIENTTWRANGTLGNYSATRNGTGAWNESRAFSYNSRGQLVNEGFSPAAAASGSEVYSFEGAISSLGDGTDFNAGSGALSRREDHAAATDAFAPKTLDQTPDSSGMTSANSVAPGVDRGGISPEGESQGSAISPGSSGPLDIWRIGLTPAAEDDMIAANPVRPSGLNATAAQSALMPAGTLEDKVTTTHDENGNVVARSFPGGRLQTLRWDALGRLVRVSQRDASGNGYDWSAAYDGLGRRLQTTQQAVKSAGASGSPTLTASLYDPQQKHLEIRVALNGAKARKVYGPDTDIPFGGVQGTGGLEATILDSTGATQGVINDFFGNASATVNGTVATWTATRMGVRGPLASTQAPALTDIRQLAAATAWRGMRIDPTGFYDLGARYYEPMGGRFLNAESFDQADSGPQ
jgi:YD repeat-containing protein